MFSSRLKELLNRKGCRQAELAEYVGVKQNTVSDWINRGTSPKIEHLYRIVDFFNVSYDYLFIGVDNLPPTLRGDEKKILRLYNQLNDKNRRKELLHLYSANRKQESELKWWEEHGEEVEKMMSEVYGLERDYSKLANLPPDMPTEEIVLIDDFDKDDSPFPVMKSVAVYYDQPASAGTGTFLDSDDYELMDFPIDKIPIQTTFGVRVSGDSMMPDYNSEDIVFVKQQPTIEHSELAIFILNGGAYFKRLLKRGRDTYLESINEKYMPIQVKPSDELRVVGRVIGKYIGD